MKRLGLLTLLSLLLTSCGDYGYHPHYVISHEEMDQAAPTSEESTR